MRKESNFVKLSNINKFIQRLPPGSDLNDSIWRSNYLRSLGLDPGNLYQELEMDSRFVDTHQDISYQNAKVNLHSHTFYEVLFCRSCEGVEYLVGAERYRLRKGDVVIVPPGVSHRPLLPEAMAGPYIRDVLWMSEEFVQQMNHWHPGIMGKVALDTALLHTEEDVQASIGKLFEQGIRESESNADDRELAVIGNTITLLTQLRRAYATRSARPMQAERPELLDRVLQYIEKNLAHKISLAEVAHHFFVSESTIAQLFRKKMGVSFYHCVTQRRLIAAKTLISQGMPLEAISHQVGFSDYSAFYKAFKKEYGISPRQYRELP